MLGILITYFHNCEMSKMSFITCSGIYWYLRLKGGVSLIVRTVEQKIEIM